MNPTTKRRKTPAKKAARTPKEIKEVIVAAAKQIADIVHEKLTPKHISNVPSVGELSSLAATLLSHRQGSISPSLIEDAASNALQILKYCKTKVRELNMEERERHSRSTERSQIKKLKADSNLKKILKKQRLTLLEFDGDDEDPISWREAAAHIFADLSEKDADKNLQQAIFYFGMRDYTTGRITWGTDVFEQTGFLPSSINKLMMEVAKDRHSKQVETSSVESSKNLNAVKAGKASARYRELAKANPGKLAQIQAAKKRSKAIKEKARRDAKKHTS